MTISPTARPTEVFQLRNWLPISVAYEKREAGQFYGRERTAPVTLENMSLSIVS